jgi:hydrogenase expression/formation protein HypC
MCIGIPGKVVAVGVDGARVEMGGQMRRASTLLLPDVVPGEWVLVSAGTIVDRLTEEEATERTVLFQSLADALDNVDDERHVER